MGHADYVQNTGSYGGQMLVRVADAYGTNGVISANEVQFFVRSGLTATYVYTPGFGTSVYVNGGWVGLANVQNYSNSTAWRHVGTIYVGTSQTIIFHINYSGTQGFGGPTDFYVNVNRATIPTEPRNLHVLNQNPTAVAIAWLAPASDGGAGIGGYLVRYWSTPDGSGPSVDHSVENNQIRTISGLTPGRTYRFVVYANNSAGWSPGSAPLVVTLGGIIRVKINGVWTSCIPYVKDNGIWKVAIPYVKDGGIWKIAG